MNQLTDLQNQNYLERIIARKISDAVAPLDARLEILETPAVDAANFSAPPNYLVNSHPEWSTLAFTTGGTSPSTVSDANRNAYNWFYQTAAATDLSSSTALLGTGHSGFAGLNADAPIWDFANGTFNIGSSTTNYDVSCPLTTDFVFPGQVFYIYLELMLASAAIDTSSARLFCEFWDDTAGQRKIIEGSDFTPTISVFGATGARTLEYKILARTDTGTEMLSTAVSVANAPATLSAENHIRLSFTGAPGFIYFGIYRKDGTTYRKVHEIRNSIDLQFYDMQENAGSIETGYPSVTTNRPQAFAITSVLDSLVPNVFTPFALKINTPGTYDRSNTNNASQHFRFGLNSLLPSGSERGLVVRRISVSEGYGGWTRSPNDLLAASAPTTTASSAPGPGNPTGDPPDGGGGGPINCLVLNTKILTTNGEKPLSELTPRKDFLECGAFALQLKKFTDGDVQEVYEIRTENGKMIQCTDSHRIVTSLTDRRGTPVKKLGIGNNILTYHRDKFVLSRIIQMHKILGSVTVRSIDIPSPHLFISNGIVSHNRKNEDQGN